MNVTINSPFKAPPTISFAGFNKVLTDADSPFTQQAKQIYGLIVSKGHDPGRWLAIAKHEHQFGTDPNSVFVRSQTRSWTNARSIQDPSLKSSAKIIHDPVRNSDYVKYNTYTDSVQDGLYRVDDPNYVYAHAKTIFEVISVWAPKTDSNDPLKYATDVANSTTTWSNLYPYNPNEENAGGTPDMTYRDDSRFPWIPDQSEFGYGTGIQHGRSGQNIELLILHITAGTDSLDWLVKNHQSSAHYLTTNTGAPRAQMVAEADAAWTAGSREYNERGINVEVEMLNVNGWTDAIMRQTAKTIAPIMKRNNIPAIYVGRNAPKGTRGMIGHRDVPDPDNPGKWGGSTNHDDPGANFDWPKFAQYVSDEMKGASTVDENANYDEITQKYIHENFGTFWHQKGGLDIFGRPLTGAFMEDVTVDDKTGEQKNLLVQYFERAVFEYHDYNPDAYKVLLRRLGAADLAARYPNGAPA